MVGESKKWQHKPVSWPQGAQDWTQAWRVAASSAARAQDRAGLMRKHPLGLRSPASSSLPTIDAGPGGVLAPVDMGIRGWEGGCSLLGPTAG